MRTRQAAGLHRGSTCVQDRVGGRIVGLPCGPDEGCYAGEAAAEGQRRSGHSGQEVFQAVYLQAIACH